MRCFCNRKVPSLRTWKCTWRGEKLQCHSQACLHWNFFGGGGYVSFYGNGSFILNCERASLSDGEIAACRGRSRCWPPGPSFPSPALGQLGSTVTTRGGPGGLPSPPALTLGWGRSPRQKALPSLTPVLGTVLAKSSSLQLRPEQKNPSNLLVPCFPWE